MAFPRLGGSGIPLSVQGGFGTIVPAGTTQGPTNAVTLQSAETFQLPAGTFAVALGPYTSLQWFDPVGSGVVAAGMWRTINAAPSLAPHIIDSDGGNWRIANLTGCPVGALITSAGSSLTNGIGTVTVTPSAGGSKWQSVIGGSINSTINITSALGGSGGAGYLYAPLLVFSPPPSGGIQATGYCGISNATVNTVTVTNQGAGYTTAPTITVVNDVRDAVGSGAVLLVNTTLANSGSLTAMYPTDPGTAAVTAVPTFTFNPTSTITATMLMNFTVTGITTANGGSGYGTAQPYLIISQGGLTTAARAAGVAGPIADSALTLPRMAQIAGVSGTGTIQTTSLTIVDAGFGFQAIPNAVIIPAGTAVVLTTIGQATFSVGGTTDTSWVQPI